MLLDVKGWAVSKYSGRPIFIVFTKENWIWAMTRHDANNILLTRNLLFDSNIRQWSHSLMLPLHCLWTPLNYGTCGQFECDMILFLLWFCFDFVHSHARCGCCSIVCLRCQDVQIKQVDCKMSTKNVNNYNKEHFVIFLDSCTHKYIKSRKSR